jgi:hypothetical protein
VRAPPSALYKKVVRSDASPREVRVQVQDMARRFPASLEIAADHLGATGPQPQASLELARFKSNAVPALQGAFLQAEPIGALVDGWALLVQLQDALPAAAPWAPTPAMREAVAALEHMESEVQALWRSLRARDDISKAIAQVHGWAHEHPLRGTVLSRISTRPLLARLTTQSEDKPLQALASASEDIRDLGVRLDLYTAMLPKQARWQAELFAGELSRGQAFQSALDLVRQGQWFANTLPSIVQREKMALRGYVAEQRQSIFSEVDHQRTALIEGVHAEGNAALTQVDNMARSWMDSAFDRVRALVNRLFLYAVILVVLAALSALIVIRFAHSPTEGDRAGRVIPRERHG